MLRKSVWALALGTMALSGCVAVVPLPIIKPAEVSSRANVLDGSLTLAAPEGYCVDPKSRQDGAEAAFVLWGNCAAIARDGSAPQPKHRALLSATVGPMPDVPLETALKNYETFFQSEAGRAAMARSGQAEDVEILTVQEQERRLLFKISDRSAVTKGPLDTVYWRAITGLDRHIAALSVMPMRGSALSDKAQLSLLQSLEASIRAAN
ncbi:hypothetical protein C8J27_10595 [Rhodobacter aestuarii]|uniref:Cation transport ATPase n=1 Tax=Rhodobacter aestuarii TaxID=453582 RepID=A0A1N7LMT2_9RHOB|nr:hypothetical protein [Rhodobacter aestuarii]PTV95151.1 hypothetical protein C8J27_10595 [Rhodobacter aestuarii]SIS75130.1 hypothetical protein SAMN05421580_104181 [Rhodobacter aestuarii]